MRIVVSIVATVSLLATLLAMNHGTTIAAQANMALPDCSGTPVIEPNEYVFACADGNASILHLTWHRWNEPIAFADGDYSYNDCTPNCAAGHFHHERGMLVVWGRQRCPTGQAAYAKVLLVTPAAANTQSDSDVCKPRE